MEKSSNKLWIYISVSIAVIFWGLSIIWTNDLIKLDVPIYGFIAVRMIIASLALLLVSSLAKKLQKIKKGDFKIIFAMAFFEPFIYFIGESYGLKYTQSPTVTAVVIATIPIFTLMMGRFVFKEMLTFFNVIGIAVTIPGVILMVNSKSFSVEYWYGILFLVLALFAAVGYSSLVKVLTVKNYNSYTIATYQFTIAAVLFIPLYIALDWNTMPIWEMMTYDILKPIIALALLCSCLSFVLYINSIKHLGISKAVVFTSLIPFVSAVAAYFLGHETFNIYQILGVVVVTAGVIIAQIPGRRKTALK